MGHIDLSPETQRRVDVVFRGADRAEAESLLIEQCGRNVPFLGNADSYQLERVRFAALKVSNGDLSSLRRAVALAQTDWRDLLMAAGFGEDVHAHEHWEPS